MNYKQLKQWNYLAAHKKLIDKTKYGENAPSLEVTEIFLAQCNLLDNQYQQSIIHFYSW